MYNNYSSMSKDDKIKIEYRMMYVASKEMKNLDIPTILRVKKYPFKEEKPGYYLDISDEPDPVG
jgi:transposase